MVKVDDILEPRSFGGRRMGKSYALAVEASFENKKEAFALLDLINAEFQSDPTSTQCFDERIVQRVKECVERNKKIEEKLGTSGL